MTVVTGSLDIVKKRLEEELQEGRLLKPVAKPYNDRWASFPRIGRPLVMFENADVQALIAGHFLKASGPGSLCAATFADRSLGVGSDGQGQRGPTRHYSSGGLPGRAARGSASSSPRDFSRRLS